MCTRSFSYVGVPFLPAAINSIDNHYSTVLSFFRATKFGSSDRGRRVERPDNGTVHQGSSPIKCVFILRMIKVVQKAAWLVPHRTSNGGGSWFRYITPLFLHPPKRLSYSKRIQRWESFTFTKYYVILLRNSSLDLVRSITSTL